VEPLRDLGITTISTQGVRSTDHVAFDEVGLNGFQFLQDRVGRRRLTTELRLRRASVTPVYIGAGALCPQEAAGWYVCVALQGDVVTRRRRNSRKVIGNRYQK
jgi:hypothetical protein